MKALINRQHKILIIGLGLLGGSYAEGLSSLGFEVGAIDINQDSIDYGIKKGIIKHGQTIPTSEYISEFDLIIFCVTPKVFINFMKEYQNMFKPSSIITDVTGIKQYLVKELKPILRKDLDVVLAHPMAGKEVSGVEYADKKIFLGANFIIIPTLTKHQESISIIEDLGRLLGFKNISILSCEEHDEMIGFLSQLTHAIAVSLMTCKDTTHLVEYTGDSFRDLTRIARINENMWSELFLLNKEELLSQMELFLTNFNKLKTSIETNDTETLKNLMRKSTQNRSQFDK